MAKQTYFRYTRWRATRAVAQLLANLEASFAVDSRIFHPLDNWTGKLGFSVGQREVHLKRNFSVAFFCCKFWRTGAGFQIRQFFIETIQ